MTSQDLDRAARVAVLAASIRFTAHSISVRGDAADALALVRRINDAFDAGYRAEFVDARQRRAR